MAATTPEAPLLRLLTWFSPAFPTGAFAYSHGLEYAVEAGLVRDRATLVPWISAILERGTGLVDGVLCRLAYGAATTDDRSALANVLALADAWRPGAETAQESRLQGKAFLDGVRAGWPDPRLDGFDAFARSRGRPVALPVAVGVAGAVAAIPVQTLVAAMLHAFATSLVSAGVRLIPLGQSDGIGALSALTGPIEATTALALVLDPEDAGTATWMADLTSMRHETQTTRLFRS
jgi:urease accessory protein